MIVAAKDMPPIGMSRENLSNFIDRLPPEIADTVCSYLESTDIASLRLTSQFWTNVATPWLLQEVHLIFKPDSFERLLAISRHPVISRYVTSLFYEPDTLQKYYTQEEWESDIIGEGWMSNMPAVPMPGASEREHRAYRRDCKRLMQQPNHTYSNDELSAGYTTYMKLYEEQEELRREGYGAKALADAMSWFPNLADVCMSMGCNIVTRSDHVKRAFSAGLHIPSGDHYSIDGPGPGVSQTRSILLGAHQAGVQLKQLQLGDVDWKFFQAIKCDMEKMKQSLRSLRILELVISTGYDEDEDEIGVEIPECREYLENNSLCGFIEAAPDLEILSLSFDWFEPCCPAELKQVVRSTTWPCLRSVSFENLDVDEEDWIAFFDRHCSSLRDLNLKTIRLLQGRWAEVLEHMSKVLALESAYSRGCLLGEEPYQNWNLEPSIWAEYSDLSDQGNRTSKAIQDYLVTGGSCPLLDEEAHPQS